MAKFDDALAAAAHQLSRSGTVTNNWLLTLTDGDQESANFLRETLISEGFAEDRFGVALALPAGRKQRDFLDDSTPVSESSRDSDEVVFAAADDESAVAAEWWVMSAGVTKGPFDFPTLRRKQALGEVTASDLIRHTKRGIWRRPVEIAGLVDVDVAQPVIKPSLPIKRTKPSASRPAPQPSAIDDEQPPLPNPTTDGNLREVAQTPRGSADPMEYFLWDAGRSVGPVSRTEVEARVQSQRLSSEDFVQVGRDGDWQPISLALTGLQPSIDARLKARARREVVPASAEESDQAGVSSGSKTSRNVERAVNSSVALGDSGIRENPREQSRFKNSQTHDRSRANGKQPNAKAFHRLSEFVGGPRRFWGIVVTLVMAAVAITWYQLPPSAKTVHSALDECHQSIANLQLQQLKSVDLAKELEQTTTKVRTIRDGLKRRATSQRPAEQELLWACDYGLLPMMQESGTAIEYERVYRKHMARAKQFFDPKGAQADASLETDDALAPILKTEN